MAYISAIRKGFQIAGRIDKKYNLNKIFIDKYFPPGYRKTAHKLVDIAGAFGGGYGIYNAIQSLYAPDSPGNDNAFQKTVQQQLKTNKPYQTRSGYSRRFSTKCRPSYSNNRNFRYSRFSKRR